MTKLAVVLLTTAALTAPAFAQTQSLLMTFSEEEQSLSGSGGTVLSTLRTNEISEVSYIGPCTSVSAEKWMTRTVQHVMAGDEDADTMFFEPTLFGSIDALLSTQNWVAPVPFSNQRTIYWSPTTELNLAISGPEFRPGDVGRIGAGGQAERFITQEQFNLALGLPPAYGIDIDAIAFQPNFGVYFSIDDDVTALTGCGPMLIQDGDILCIPSVALSYNADMTINTVAPLSAVVVYSETDMDAMVVAAGVTNRFGACLTAVGDVESLEIDLLGPVTTVVPCVGFALNVPNLLFSSENGTGASVLETQGGGAIRNSTCGPMGTACGWGPTLGFQVGVQPFSGNIGSPSYVNALCETRGCRFVLEPEEHVQIAPLGAPLGATMIDYHNPFPWAFSFITLTAPPLPFSVPAFPFSPNCFPDLYTTSLTPWFPMTTGFGQFPMVSIPPAWSGKVLYQAVGWGGPLELSTPAVVDVN